MFLYCCHEVTRGEDGSSVRFVFLVIETRDVNYTHEQSVIHGNGRVCQ